jgi:Arm DNA-binding domain
VTASLNDTAIRAAKPREKSYKLFDALGLYLEVAPTGSKLWCLKYRHDGRENHLALGAHPDTSLKRARDRRDAARQQLAAGID